MAGTTRRKRRNLRAWVLQQFGNGIWAPCEGCGCILTDDDMTLDRYPRPGKHGGGYTRDNVRPMCVSCNTSHDFEPDAYIECPVLVHTPFQVLGEMHVGL